MSMYMKNKGQISTGKYAHKQWPDGKKFFKAKHVMLTSQHFDMINFDSSAAEQDWNVFDCKYVNEIDSVVKQNNIYIFKREILGSKKCSFKCVLHFKAQRRLANHKWKCVKNELVVFEASFCESCHESSVKRWKTGLWILTDPGETERRDVKSWIFNINTTTKTTGTTWKQIKNYWDYMRVNRMIRSRWSSKVGLQSEAWNMHSF